MEESSVDVDLVPPPEPPEETPVAETEPEPVTEPELASETPVVEEPQTAEPEPEAAPPVQEPESAAEAVQEPQPEAEAELAASAASPEETPVAETEPEPEPTPEPPAPEPVEAAPPEPQPAPPQATPEPLELRESLQTLRPVFAFGEEESGPEVSEEGGAEAGTETPETLSDDAGGEEAASGVGLPSLTPAQRIYSTSATGAVQAVAAIGGRPRTVRGSDLCATELREQLRHGEPAYWPDLLPAYRLPEGVEIAVSDAAFRADGQWYDLSFRCEVDPDATRVVSFSLSVGAPIPRGQWARRGFPEG